MKAKSFISFAVCVAVSVLMCSCSNEESADSNNNSNSNSNGQLTAFTGGIATEAPMERMQLSTPEISTEVPGFLTRTSMSRNDIGHQGVFLWEPKDVIYVEDDNKTLFKSQNTINAAVDCATFLVDGSYTVNGKYDVYYCGTNPGAEKKQVVIASNQTLAAFNNTKHFGAAGDCGVAKAEKTTVEGKSGYSFELEHKASYLCFLPYMPIKVQRENFRIKRIEITSDNNIAGTYELTQDGLSKGTNESKTITLNVGTDGKGLKLVDQATKTKSIKNSLYVVIAPGTHTLTVKYTISDAKNTEATITESYKSHNFGANKICDIPVDLSVRHYSGRNYYMWDAKENYWYGHEWDAVTPWQPTGYYETNSGFPKSKADVARWYHEGSDAFEVSNSLFKQLPNANEMAWYVLKGDAHWDRSTPWEVFGRIYKRGIWLKKLSVIAHENGKEKSADLKLKDPNDKDLCVSDGDYASSIDSDSGKPADSKISNYFFLPALGYYYNGQFKSFSAMGYYWSSSPASKDISNAYELIFSRDNVHMSFTTRSYGYVALPFEESPR